MRKRALLVVTLFTLAGCASQPPARSSAPADEHAAHHPPVNDHAAHHPPGKAGPAGEGMMGQGMMGQGMMGGDMMSMKGMCPVEVPGTTAEAEEPTGAAALVFKTTGDVAEVRKRVARMAEMHNHHQPGGAPTGDNHAMGGGMMGQGMMGGGMMGGGMMMPPATARSEETETGARLIFTPAKAEDLQALRDKVKKHADDMATHKCPMMQHTKTASATPAP